MPERSSYHGAKAFLLDGELRLPVTPAFLRRKGLDGEYVRYEVVWDCDPSMPVSAIEVVDDVGCLGHSPVTKPESVDPRAWGFSCTLRIRIDPFLKHGEYRLHNEDTIRRC